MFHARRIARLALAASVASLYSCDSAGPEEFIDVELTLSDSVLVLRTPITVNVTATNLGRRAVRVGAHPCPPKLEVQDMSGRVVVDWRSVFCTLEAIAPRELDPGDSFGFQYSWDGSIPASGGEYLEDGAYRIQGWLVIVPGTRSYSKEREFIVTSEAPF